LKSGKRVVDIKRGGIKREDKFISWLGDKVLRGMLSTGRDYNLIFGVA